jgi:hypothetical protein
VAFPPSFPRYCPSAAATALAIMAATSSLESGSPMACEEPRRMFSVSLVCGESRRISSVSSDPREFSLRSPVLVFAVYVAGGEVWSAPSQFPGILYEGVEGVENSGILRICAENSRKVFLKNDLSIAQSLGKGLGSVERRLLDAEEVEASRRG